MNATAHFQTRIQQRAFSQAMLAMIFDLGQNNAKGDLVLLGKNEIDRALQKLKELRSDLERMRSKGGAGVAYDGETLITAFHRTKKFMRD